MQIKIHFSLGYNNIMHTCLYHYMLGKMKQLRKCVIIGMQIGDVVHAYSTRLNDDLYLYTNFFIVFRLTSAMAVSEL